MGRQFPPAGGTGPIVRRANGSAFRPANFGAPLPSFWECEGFDQNLERQPAGMRRAATLPHATTMDGEKGDAEICAPNVRHSPPSCPRLSRASTPWHQSKAWMAGTSPAMTNFDSVQVGTALVLSRVDEVAKDAGLAELLAGFKPLQALDQNE